MLESVMIIRLATGARVEVVGPFGFSKAGFLSGCPVELGVVAASKEGTEDAEFRFCVGVCDSSAPEFCRCAPAINLKADEKKNQKKPVG